MSTKVNWWQLLQQKLRRDAQLPWQQLVYKSLNYTYALTMTPWRLRHINKVGQGVRTMGHIHIENFGYIEIGDQCLLRSVVVPIELCAGAHATLIIGKHASINYGTSIGSTKSIKIGHYVRMGPYVMIVDSQFHDVHNRAVRPDPKPVTIEDHVWLGAKAIVLPGVTIGRGSVVGAGAVVTRDVPPLAIVAGVPAKIVGRLDPARFEPEGEVF